MVLSIEKKTGVFVALARTFEFLLSGCGHFVCYERLRNECETSWKANEDTWLSDSWEKLIKWVCCVRKVCLVAARRAATARPKHQNLSEIVKAEEQRWRSKSAEVAEAVEVACRGPWSSAKPTSSSVESTGSSKKSDRDRSVTFILASIFLMAR